MQRISDGFRGGGGGGEWALTGLTKIPPSDFRSLW